VSQSEGKLAALILAAGASRRMGSPKALLRWEKEAVLDTLIGKLRACCDPVVVVLGHHAGEIRAGMSRAAQALITLNPGPERGQLSSLQCGLAAMPAACGVMFTPVDYPAMREETIRLLAETFLSKAHPRPVVAPRCGGRSGHPVVLPSWLWEEFARETGTARDVLRRHRGATVYCDVTDPGVLGDMDTHEDYRKLLEAAGLA